MACQFDARKPEMVRNLLKLYRSATPEDIRLGSRWYEDAHRIVIEWADTYGFSIATVACVIAAISPHCGWNRNLIIADDILAGRAQSIGGALHLNVRKAERIRDDRADDTIPYFPQGPKVKSFAHNLAGDWSCVTVDTHATQAALNDVLATVYLKWQPYHCFAACYCLAAAKLGIEPAVFQAIIWHVWKRRYPWGKKQKIRQQWSVCGELRD